MNFKGAAKRLDDVDLPRLGATIGIGEDEIHAFMDVESAGSGFDAQGRPKMLFEPHIFYRQLIGKQLERAVARGVAYPKWGMEKYPLDSYARLEKAMEINFEAALRSASWGLTQILGLHHLTLHYETAEAMVLAFMADEENHLKATIELLVSMGIDDELRRLEALKRPTNPDDCRVIVRVYNGQGYERNEYHIKFAKAHNRWRKIKDTPL